jgi:hypothetical protein
VVRGLARGTPAAIHAIAMNDDETDEVIVLDQLVVDGDDLVEVDVELVDDDYEPVEEVILLDIVRLDDDDLLDVA